MKGKQNMYYIAVKQRFDNGFVKRNTLIVANSKFFADLWDEYSIAVPPMAVMNKDTFDRIIKDGYATEKAAKNDKKMLKRLEDYIGPFFQTEYSIVDENSLKELYKDACNPQKE